MSLFIFILGLSFGSFVNALVWRMNIPKKKQRLSKKQKREISVLNGRSMCVHCRHELAWYDLLPVISWMSLGGRCRYCSRSISWQYPVVELVTACLFVYSYVVWPYGYINPVSAVLMILWFTFVTVFMALIVYDLRWMLLPNSLVYPLIVLAVVHVAVRMVDATNSLQVLLGSVGGFLTIGGLFYVLFQVSEGKWIGGGDVKLAFMIGPLVGSIPNALMVIFIASFVGTLICLPLLLKNTLKTTSRIPFGPLLIFATIVVYLHGGQILDWFTTGLA